MTKEGEGDAAYGRGLRGSQGTGRGARQVSTRVGMTGADR